MEVIIVGAGPAGLATAIELLVRAPEHRVTILEAVRRENTFDPKYPGAGHSMCSGGLGKRMIEEAGYAIPDSVVMAPIRQAIFEGPTESVTIRAEDVGEESLGLVMDRKKFDDWLLKRAMDLGAIYVPGERAFTCYRTWGDSKWHVTTRPGWTYDADFLVGADGPESAIAEQLFQAPEIPEEDMFLGSEAYVTPFVGEHAFPQDAIMLHFEEPWKGYAWAFAAGKPPMGPGASPVRQHVVKVGMGTTRASKLNAGKEAMRWREMLAARYGDEEYVKPGFESVGGRITAAKPLRQVVRGDGVALVGEAGRAVIASLGAGDASAVRTGRALGHALARGKPSEYQRFWNRHVYPMHRRHWKIKDAILRLDNAGFDRAIRLLADFPVASLSAYEVPKIVAYLARKDPFFVGRTFLPALMPW